MHLSSIQLTHFKNHKEAKHDFSEHLNLIVGLNGTGKTNLLDAIHFLCNTKSAFTSIDQNAIQQNEAFFRLEGVFEDDGRKEKVECVCQNTTAKTFLVNGKAPEKLASYIGRFPVVLTSPYDTDLIREGSELRRKFFDLVLSQVNQAYLETLMAYNRLLKQRNASLKQMAESGRRNFGLLEVYDQQMLPLAQQIGKERQELIGLFLGLTQTAYQQLANLAEHPAIRYVSDTLASDFQEQFKSNHVTDLLAQRTTLGPHTDDYELSFNEGVSLKKMGSQGQQKTFSLALRLAHFQFIQQSKGTKPLLLLDDIFDRLDETRIQKIAQMVKEKHFGQVFVTDASPNRVEAIFGKDLSGVKVLRMG
jgi:DNA replication and repair protein RecF